MEKKVGSGGKWEPIVGYSRGVRRGDHVFIAGTTAARNDGTVTGIGDPYLQSVEAFRTIGRALNELGASFEDVVRTRTFVVNIDDWELIGKAHGEIFHAIRPAATMVEVKRLIHPDMLVEIEVDAVIRNRS